LATWSSSTRRQCLSLRQDCPSENAGEDPFCAIYYSNVFVATHAEYPARILLSRYHQTHGPHIYVDWRQPIRTVVYPRALNRQRRAARQLLFVEDDACALAWLATSNLASKNNTLSLSTQLCRRRHHAREVQRFFSTRSASDVSWGKSVV
jgi:hypothetical protein